MGKRYYCDYCDRSFKDDPEARKKHLLGLQHVKNRAEHYSLFRDPEDILKEETCKQPCKRFMSFGQCMFGNGCRYSHYTPPMIWELQRIVAAKNQAKFHSRHPTEWPNPEEIIKEYFENDMVLNDTDDSVIPTWTRPAELNAYPMLPPSLWPLTPERFTDSNFGEWGRL